MTLENPTSFIYSFYGYTGLGISVAQTAWWLVFCVLLKGCSSIQALDAKRQELLKEVADLSAETVSKAQIEAISNYLDDWDNTDFDDKRRVIDSLIVRILATSENVEIEWKLWFSHYVRLCAFVPHGSNWANTMQMLSKHDPYMSTL